MTNSSKNQLTEEELIPGGMFYRQFLPLRMEEISFSQSGEIYRYKKNEFYCAKSVRDQHSVWSISLFSFGELLEGIGVKAVTSLPTFHFLKNTDEVAWVKLSDFICFIDCHSCSIIRKIKIKTDWENILFNEEKGLFSFASKNALWLLDLNGGKRLLHKEKNRSVLSGAVPSRNEFGIEQGAFWSPDGSKLAFYIVDQTGISSYPLVKVQDPIATLESIKYPMAGANSETVRLAVYDVERDKTIMLQPSDWEESYLTCVTWSLDAKHLYCAEVDRSQKHCRLLAYDVCDGHCERTLFEECDEKYVEPQHPLFFLDDEHFVWQSRRDGYNHLYLYDVRGNLIRQLTQGTFEVTQLCGRVEATDELVFLSTQSSPLNRDLCAVKISGGCVRILSKEKGTHSVAISSKNGCFIDSFSSAVVPGKSFLRNFIDDSESLLCEADNPYKDYEMPVTEIGSYEKDGEEIFYRIVRPATLEKGVRYPLAYYVYGGPHVQLIRNEWLAGTKGFEYMMALNGYIVMSIDPHGSDNRGKEFEQKIWRNIGAVQMEDYQYSIEWLLKNKEYVDSKRMGVYGWSFGGFMATRLMLRCPKLFKLGVAGGAVIDWASYEVMYTERYMETPKQNSDGFAENDMKRFVKNLTNDMLFIHCDNDPVVLWQNTLLLLKEAIKNGKQIDYALYPGHQHNVQGPDRVHLMQKIRRYFDSHFR